MNTEENNREPEETTPGSEAEPLSERPESGEGVAAEGHSEESASPETAAQSESFEEGEILIEGEEDSESLMKLEVELDQVTRERDEYLDSMLRLRAEFDNSRKRLERERERILQTASERILVSLLPVLDNLDRALQSEGDVREGVRATRDQLAEVLDREGLLPVDSDGEHFDPNVHEAVMSQPSEEHEEGTILQTFERGYLLNGKTVRVAKVVVAQ